MFNGKDVLDELDAADYAVFDDIQGGIKFFHGFKNWLGCQTNFNIRLFHKDPPTIEWNRPVIWVANSDPRLDMSPGDVSWLEENAIFCEVTQPIFHASTASQ